MTDPQDRGPCQRVGDDPGSAPRGASANSGNPLKGSAREPLAAYGFAVVDRRTNNILGEFATRAEAEEMLARLVEADARAEDVELVEVGSAASVSEHLREIAESIVDTRTIEGQLLLSVADQYERMHDALREIVRMGVKFDARGTHSARVVDIAREALSGGR